MSLPDDTRRYVRSPATRRDDLLAAAVRVIITEGSANVSVADIAAEAGVAKGTFYLYFESKEALLAELRAAVTAEFAELFKVPANVRTVEQWRRVLHAELENLVDVQLKYHALYRAVCAPEHSAGLISARLVLSVLQRFIEQGRAVGVFNVTDAELTAAFLFNAVQGTCANAGEPDRKRLTRSAQELADRALGLVRHDATPPRKG